MLLTVAEAFDKFRSNLEPTNSEVDDASRRHQKIRSQIAAELSVADSFLTGSYARHTAVRPLKDVDIMIVLAEDENDYLRQNPQCVLNRICEILEPHYPNRVHPQSRSVTVEFGINIVDDISDKVVAIDVVPAFPESTNYQIPDTHSGTWILTNPKEHQRIATDCNAALNGHWIPLVKMAKKANSHAGSQNGEKPVRPNFLLEVMAHTLVVPPWVGPYSLELRALFASVSDLIDQRWPDPAGLGPDVNSRLLASPNELAEAKRWLDETVATCDLALRHARDDRIGAALNTWQKLFGPLFVKTKAT